MRRIVRTAAVVGISWVLAGCGGSGSAAPPAARPAPAPQAPAQPDAPAAPPALPALPVVVDGADQAPATEATSRADAGVSPASPAQPPAPAPAPHPQAAPAGSERSAPAEPAAPVEAPRANTGTPSATGGAAFESKPAPQPAPAARAGKSTSDSTGHDRATTRAGSAAGSKTDARSKTDAANPSTARAPRPMTVTPRPGMANLRPISWDRIQKLSERQVRVHFTGGAAPCAVLDSVRVEYRPSLVTITLYAGTDPTARDRVCAAVAAPKVVEVELAKPLAGRTVVDGAQAEDGGAPAGTIGQSGVAEVIPQPGTVQTRAIGFDRAIAVGPRTLRVYFTAGTAPCSVLDRVAVGYAADRITVTLYAGRSPGAKDRACALGMRSFYVDVDLQENLAGRRIADGATLPTTPMSREAQP